MSFAPGTRLGPYEITGPLGAGGMGEVYRAKDTRLGRQVAVKALPSGVGSDPESLRRFEQEARAASALNHPNILTVHDVGALDGAPYLVTELLEGESLSDRTARGPIPVQRAVEIAVQVACGLAAAHEKGIVHRDLKPGNLFVTDGGLVKILDFGLAKTRPPAPPGTLASEEASTVSRLTGQGVVLGTVGYMAPEQVRGESADARSDLFAFGIVLYEMLTGRRAFQRGSAVETLGAILNEEPPDLAASAPDLPAVLEHVVRRCLEKRPERRFQSASDLAFALGEVHASPSPGGTAAAASPQPRALRARWAGPALLAGGALLLALGLLFSVPSVRERILGGGPARIDSLAVLPLANLSGDSGQEFFADGMTEALIAELAKVRALKVISRTSVMQYKQTKRPLPEIARELGVRAIVEGSVLRDGANVRITVQLIEGRDDRHLWAESYTREARDVLRLQAEVAQAIAREIRVTVTPDEKERLAGARPVDPKAHELLLQASWFQSHADTQRDAVERAIDLARQAVARAPDLAPAHLALAQSLFVGGGNGYRPMPSACADARAELARALELDPGSGTASLASGSFRMFCDFDWIGAERDFLRALDVNPGLSGPHSVYGWFLSDVGRHTEALEQARRALELDPLNEWMSGYLAQRLHFARREEDAAAQIQRMLSSWPDSIFGKWILGLVRTAQGRYDDAVSVLVSRKVAHPEMSFAVGLAHGLAGRKKEARAVLDYLLEKRRTGFVPPTMIAAVHMGLGERDAALEWLERGYEERSMLFGGLKVDPMWDPLRGDPRFEAILKRMNYPGGR